MLNDYIGILTNPKETITQIVKRKIELMDSAVLLIISTALVSLVTILVEPTPGMDANLFALSTVGLVILATLFTFLQTGFSIAILRFLAKWAGGKGSYADNMAPFAFIVPLVTLIGVIVSRIPVVGIVVNILWWIYTLYLYILTASIANKIGMKDAAIVVLAPLALLILIVIVVVGPFIILGALLAASGGLNAVPPMP